MSFSIDIGDSDDIGSAERQSGKGAGATGELDSP
jgi:hypothetical protein